MIQALIYNGMRVLLPTAARCRIAWLILWSLGCGLSSFASAVPSAEKLLPDDTFFVLTTPDFARLRALYASTPQARFWNDPALKPFKDNFLSHWKDEILKPIERDLDLRLTDFSSLAKGQVTFAITRKESSGNGGQNPGLILLLDTKDKAVELKSTLAKFRKKWVDSGRVLRTEKIREFEFLVLAISSNEVPQNLALFFPHAPEVQQLGAEAGPKKPAQKIELVVGQADSLFLAGNSLKALEKVIVRLLGGAVPSLGEFASYQANHLALFRDAPLYGWLNVKTWVRTQTPTAAQKESSVPDPLPVAKPDKMIAALGLTGVSSFAFSIRNSNEGTLLEAFLAAPESSRQGLLKMLAGEPKDTSIPGFVPGDAVNFQRWRLDGRKSWTALEKYLAEISPQSLSAINFILDTANLNARQKDSGFDVRQNLIGNLGDDIITYEKVPRGPSGAELQSPPSITLLASPNPEQFVAALKHVLIFMTSQAAAPGEREFLGRKILSVPLPAVPLPMLEPKPGPPRTLHYAASAGYVALSTDASLLEEFLRSSESQARGLRAVGGLIEASQKVTGPGTSLFGFQNQAETMRGKFEAFKHDPSSATNSAPSNPLTASLGVGTPEKTVKDWMDFSLLPSFESVSKYFHFSVYGGGATVDGLSFKYFIPVPAALKAAQASAPAK